MTTIARERLVSPSAPINRVRRLGGVAALLVAPWGFVVANTAYAWAIREGGSDSTGAEALALAGAYPMLLRVGVLAGMCGCLLLVPAILGAFRLAPTSWLVLVGGSAMIVGYVCYFGVLIGNFSELASRSGRCCTLSAWCSTTMKFRRLSVLCSKPLGSAAVQSRC